MYFDGRSVPRDDAEAAKWFRKAADQEDAAAQYYLALMYRQGRGVTMDYAEAAKWYRKAADQGYPDAQHELWLMYADGEGVPEGSRARACFMPICSR